MATIVNTKARYRALETLILNGGKARVSNRTEARSVYWQTARWLVERGLAREIHGGTWIELTDFGHEAWREANP
ncbi:MAG: hypothetical protein ACRCW4_05810 [Candidatus Neomicrothrix subdominans]